MHSAESLIEALDLSPFERHALTGPNRNRDELRQSFTCYLALREKIAKDYLPVVNSKLPYINDHSRTHLRRVLSHVERILTTNFRSPHNTSTDIPRDRIVTWADTLILINALVWHDMGNIYGREGHADRVRQCFESVSGMLYDAQIAEYIKQVAEAHSGKDRIEQVIPNSHAALAYNGEDVHLQFLAAVLRFADELDEDRRRISPPEWRDMERDGEPFIPLESQRFWYFSECNRKIEVVPRRGQRDTSLHIEMQSHIPCGEFETAFLFERTEDAPDKYIRGLSEYFRRVFKIERERNYCSKYMRTAYYHPGIESINVQLYTDERGATANSTSLITFELSDRVKPEDLLRESSLDAVKPYIEEALES